MKKHLLLAALAFVSLFSFTSCLQKDIELDLPPFQSELVIEAYMYENEPMRVLVSKTGDYFGEFQLPFIFDAAVVLEYNGRTDTLIMDEYFDPETGRFFNFRSLTPVQVVDDAEYRLTVIDRENNRTATATTRYIRPVPIDTCYAVWRIDDEGDTASYILTRWTEDAGKVNFYRYQSRNLTGEKDTSRENEAGQDFFTDDKVFSGQLITVGEGYNYLDGDTARVRLYHLDQSYYNYYNTTTLARDALGNPFGQPTRIEGNISGGIGIFTWVVFDERTLYLKY